MHCTQNLVLSSGNELPPPSINNTPVINWKNILNKKPEDYLIFRNRCFVWHSVLLDDLIFEPRGIYGRLVKVTLADGRVFYTNTLQEIGAIPNEESAYTNMDNCTITTDLTDTEKAYCETLWGCRFIDYIYQGMLGTSDEYIYSAISKSLLEDMKDVQNKNIFGIEAAYRIQSYIEGNMRTFFATCPESEKVKAAQGGCQLCELVDSLYYLHKTKLPWNDFACGNIDFEYVNKWLLDRFPHINISIKQQPANSEESTSSYFY